MEKKTEHAAKKKKPGQSGHWLGPLLALVMMGTLVFNLGCDDADVGEPDFIRIDSVQCAQPQALVGGNPLDYEALGLSVTVSYAFDYEVGVGNFINNGTFTWTYPFPMDATLYPDLDTLRISGGSITVSGLSPAQGTMVPETGELTISLTLTAQQPATTQTQSITLPIQVPKAEFVVAQPPLTTTYNVGDELDLEGVVLTYTPAGGDAVDIPFAEFEANGITASPAQGNTLGTLGEQTIIFAHADSGLRATTTVTVESTNETITIPDMTWFHVGEAVQALEALGVTVEVTEVEGTTFAASMVYAQTPVGGVELPPSGESGITVQLTVSKATTSSMVHGVPSVIGKTAAYAEDILRAAGFVPNVVEVMGFFPGEQNGKAYAQLPWPGEPLSLGGEVTVYIGQYDGSSAPELSDPEPSAPAAPTWTNGPTAVANGSSIDIVFNTNTNARVYVLILLSTQPAPNVSELIASTSATMLECGPGSGNPGGIVSNMVPGPFDTYSVYLVAVDTATGTRQASVTMLTNITTA